MYSTRMIAEPKPVLADRHPRPDTAPSTHGATQERSRIRAEYQRRAHHLDPELYAPWNPAELFLVQDRKRHAAHLLHAADQFPDANSRCLEIGFGHGGWLSTLIGWGARETNLFGVEIDHSRGADTRRRLPAARLVLADGGWLPWPDGSFHLVVLSLVMTSVLDLTLRRRIANEVERVMAPAGALLWYDFAVDNPHNPHVRAVNSQELRALFPSLEGKIRSTSLAPPLARRVAPRSHWLAELLSCLPFLQTHLLGVLLKPTTPDEERLSRHD